LKGSGLKDEGIPAAPLENWKRFSENFPKKGLKTQFLYIYFRK